MNAAWIAVIGTLGGVVAGGATNVVLERMRWTRDEQAAERQRAAGLVERRRERCIELSALADEIRSRLWSFVDYKLADPQGWRTDDYVQKQQDLLETAIAQFDRTFNELWILGMESFEEQAHALNEIVGATVSTAYGDPPEHGDLDDVGRKLAAFLDAVSNDESVGGRKGLAIGVSEHIGAVARELGDAPSR